MPRIGKKNLEHGKYVLVTNKGIFLFDTKWKKGRLVRTDGRATDFDHISHPDLVKSILLKGDWTPSIGREAWEKKG